MTLACYRLEPMAREDAPPVPTDAAAFADLVTRIAGGDRAAEADVCRRFAERIRHYGLRHLRDADHARELVQMVLVAVLEALRAGRVADPARLDRFVLGTCRHLALRIRDADARAEPTDVAALPIAAEALEPTGLDAEALFRCMNRLDVRARTVLQMTFYRDRETAEIAAVLDTSPGNVRVVRHRALADLRRCLEHPAEAR